MNTTTLNSKHLCSQCTNAAITASFPTLYWCLNTSTKHGLINRDKESNCPDFNKKQYPTAMPLSLSRYLSFSGEKITFFYKKKAQRELKPERFQQLCGFVLRSKF